MRIRLPFAGVFFVLLAVTAYSALSSLELSRYVDDKFLHFVTFFFLTIVFYWIIDTNRRRTLNLTLIVVTLVLGVGSEFLQSFLPSNGDFDIYDIVANVVGSLAGLGLCSWYHKRMLERKRQRKQYNAVPGEEDGDVELGEGHENGVTDAPPRTLEEEVDNWDENAVDNWDEEEGDGDIGASSKGKDVDTGDIGDSSKRDD